MSNKLFYIIAAAALESPAPDFAFLPSSGLLQNYIFNGGKFTKLGSNFALAVDRPAITAHTERRISWANYLGASGSPLGMYKWANWVRVGNLLTTSTGGSTQRIAAMSATKIAHTGTGTGDALKTFTFDGTDWAQTGNTLNIGTAISAMCGLSSSRVATVTSSALGTRNFDGTDWTTVGNTLALGAANAGYGICALSSTSVAVVQRQTGGGNKFIRTFDFDGTNWAQVGNSFTAIPDVFNMSLCSLSSTRIIMAMSDTANDRLMAFDFDGTDWADVGTPLAAIAAASTGQTLASLVFRVF